MDGSDERDVGGGGASAPYALAGMAGRTRTSEPPVDPAARPEPPRPPDPVVHRGTGSPTSRRQTLTTAAAVCVIAASLAVVGWINWTVGQSSPPGGRYAVVDAPPDAAGSRPPDVRSSPQPLVPLLPPDRATGPKTGSSSRKPTSPAGRGTTPRPTAPVTGPAGAISGYAGKCLHVPGDKPVDGIPVEMIGCDGGPGERWTVASDGTVRAFGKCLEIVGDQVVDGAAVRLSTCNGGPGQQWRFTAGRDLVNPKADKCLDVRDFNLNDGALVQLWTCAGGPNQKWSVPA
jgi:Ricin-type beta-trefoil lectin domain